MIVTFQPFSLLRENDDVKPDAQLQNAVCACTCNGIPVQFSEADEWENKSIAVKMGIKMCL